VAITYSVAYFILFILHCSMTTTCENGVKSLILLLIVHSFACICSYILIIEKWHSRPVAPRSLTAAWRSWCTPTFTGLMYFSVLSINSAWLHINVVMLLPLSSALIPVSVTTSRLHVTSSSGGTALPQMPMVVGLSLFKIWWCGCDCKERHLKLYDAIQMTQNREVWRKSVEELLTRVEAASPRH